MTGPASMPPATERKAARGLVAELISLVGSLGKHVKALAALAGTEAKEAGGVYFRALILVVVALVFAAFGYVLLVIFVAFLLATIFHIDWLWISLGLALLHLAGAVACVLIAKSKVSAPVFATTSEELKRDLDALQNWKP